MTIVGGLSGSRALAAATSAGARRLDNLRPEMTRAGGTVQSRAGMLAPKRTGRLAGSVRGVANQHAVDLVSDVVYAGVIHWGWAQHSITAQPWLLDAAHQTEPQWVSYFEELVDDITDDMARAT